jgi:hypothetical protein
MFEFDFKDFYISYIIKNINVKFVKKMNKVLFIVCSTKLDQHLYEKTS